MRNVTVDGGSGCGIDARANAEVTAVDSVIRWTDTGIRATDSEVHLLRTKVENCRGAAFDTAKAKVFRR